jgi:hypothetical protein
MVTFSVDEEVAGFGVNDEVTPVGSPLRLSVTLPLKPPVAVIVTAYVVELPGVTERVDGVAEIENSGTATTLSVTFVV